MWATYNYVRFTLILTLIANISYGESVIENLKKNTSKAGFIEYHTVIENNSELMDSDKNYIEYYAANNETDTEMIVFFSWDYEQHHETISKLFSGDKVTLYSDVKLSDSRYDAFRLTEVQFNFKASDENIQSIINNLLYNFELDSHHLGNSYFRSNGQYYLLKTREYLLWYSLENNKEGIPVSRCFSYDSIKWFIFSPYASWALQLIPVLENSPKFPILQQYKEKIRIELVGRGSKLDEKYLKQYFEPVNSADLP